jgi:hypothetical protein
LPNQVREDYPAHCMNNDSNGIANLHNLTLDDSFSRACPELSFAANEMQSHKHAVVCVSVCERACVYECVRVCEYVSVCGYV